MTPPQLRDFRVKFFHMTHTEFAAFLHLSYTTVVAWEQGRRVIPDSMGLLVELAVYREKVRAKHRRRSRKVYARERGLRRGDGF